ncbi:MAG: Dihydrolipoamide acyltransferase component of branched-chain alpha-keto acid dehydrogenase complex [Deltaproteobacteria bacterium]|nr:Dihydrolipoamide acyltransferase component of branched-chain alpha-keto acid dehydrogenase complex [Deltaproteobacteria bacterium]
MSNLELDPVPELSTFRRLALGTWRTAYDPSVYGSLTLRMDKALAYIDTFRRATGKHLTVTHLMARAAAAVLEQYPDANVLLRHGRLYRRRSIGVFFQVAMEDPATGKVDLSGATIHDPQRKSLVEICDELAREFAEVRTDRGGALARVRRLMGRLPLRAIPAVLELTSFASYTLNLDLRWAGVPRDAFGSVMITNVGALGLEEAYVPLVPYSRVPLLLALGAIRETPVARDGRVEIEHTMKLCATFDHRVLDGTHAAAMARTMRAWIEDPFAHFDRLPEAAAGSAIRNVAT